MAAARLFFSVFAVIFVAELPDKTTLASLVMATRHRAMPVLLGACGALAVQSLIAVAAGSLLAMLPERIVHIGSGVLSSYPPSSCGSARRRPVTSRTSRTP